MAESFLASTPMLEDKPIHIFPYFKRIHFESLNHGPKIGKEMLRILYVDDKDEFVKAINRLKCADDVIQELLMDMFLLDAVNCTSAVLNGETSQIFDVNSTFYDDNKESPLHKAAYTSSPKIIKLFLDKGANPDLRCECNQSEMKGMIPLDVLLDVIWSYPRVSVWTPKESIFRLIYRLCQSQLRNSLEAVRLLAEKMEELPTKVSCYVKESKFVELAVLLMVARKKVLGSSIAEGNGLDSEMDTRSFVLAEIASLNIGLFSATGCNKLRKEYREKKAKMELTLLLLEIFERVGNTLDAYIRIDRSLCDFNLASELAWLFEVLGYKVKGEFQDDANRISSNTESYVPMVVRAGPWNINRSCIPTLPDHASRGIGQWDPRKHEKLPAFRSGFVPHSKVRWFCALPSFNTSVHCHPANQMKKMGIGVTNLHFSRQVFAAFMKGIRRA